GFGGGGKPAVIPFISGDLGDDIVEAVAVGHALDNVVVFANHGHRRRAGALFQVAKDMAELAAVAARLRPGGGLEGGDKVIPLAVLEKAVRQTQIEGIAGIDAGAGEGQEQAGATWHVIEEPGAAHVRIQADRKSTRLNSSHVKISYAVFCLKKKKKKAGG